MSFKIVLDKKSVANCEATVRKAFDKVIRNQQLMNEIGTMVVDDVQRSNRSGTSPKTEARHPALKPSTIRNRQYLAKYNPIHALFSPRRSNVTITGGLLDNQTLIHRMTKPGVLLFEFVGNHLPYKGKKGQSISDPISNEEIVKHLKAKGFFVFGFRKNIVKRSKQKVIEYIRRSSKVLFRSDK